MPRFNIGDVVYLKSGSPALTVTAMRLDQEPRIWCQWIDTVAELREGDFHPNCLTPDNPLQ